MRCFLELTVYNCNANTKDKIPVVSKFDAQDFFAGLYRSMTNDLLSKISSWHERLFEST